uniref:Uncharacterized protein n=1 Tax=Salix viminalis TaxID=40686 RepID=A0A6N2MM19_SALVM
MRWRWFDFGASRLVYYSNLQDGSENTESDTQYWSCPQEPIPVTQLVRETVAVMKEFTQSGYWNTLDVRPFGVSLLVSGFDDKGPQLHQVDPSGSYFSWKALAWGKMFQMQKHFLRRESHATSKTPRGYKNAINQESGMVISDAEKRIPVVEMLKSGKVTGSISTNMANGESLITKRCPGNDVAL